MFRMTQNQLLKIKRFINNLKYYMLDYYKIENFLDNPEKVIEVFFRSKFERRNFYEKNNGINSGLRAINRNQLVHNEIKSKLEKVLNRPIQTLAITFNVNPQYSVFGCPHSDGGKYDYAGIIYLNKVAPKNTGTTLYKDFIKPDNFYCKMQILYSIDIPPKNSIKQQIAQEILAAKQSSEVIAKFENVYNTAVVYKSDIIHSADNYFGTNKDNSRITIAFFAK